MKACSIIRVILVMELVGMARKSVDKTGIASTFNIHVIRRMLEALRYDGKVKRTQLASKSGLNYNKCVKYIHLLKLLGWLDVILAEGYYCIITQNGKEILEKLLNV